MAVYLVVDIQVKDPVGFQAYKAGVVPLVRKHSGEYLARGGATEVLEGEWAPERLTLLVFPDMEAVKAFLEDPEYQPLKALRQSCTHSRLLAVEGI